MEKPKKFHIENGASLLEVYDASEIDAWLDSVSVERIEKVIKKTLKASCTCNDGSSIVCVGCFYRKDLATAIHKLIQGQ